MNAEHGYCPVLSGKRLTLEPLRAAHADALFPLLADPQLWCYEDDGPPKNIAALRVRYRRLEARRAPDGNELWLNWALSTSENGFVGFAQATVFEDRHEAAIAYMIGKHFWSMGLGTEAAGVVIGFLANELHLRRATATVDDRNLASLRLLQKLGFHVVDDGDRRNVRLELPLTNS